VYQYYNFNGQRRMIGQISGNQGRAWNNFDVNVMTENSDNNDDHEVNIF